MSRLPEDESSASDSGDSLPPLQFVTHGTQQKVEEIGPGAWVKKIGWTMISAKNHDATLILDFETSSINQWLPNNAPWCWILRFNASRLIFWVVSAVYEVTWWNSWICRWLAWTNSRGMCWSSRLLKATKKRGLRWGSRATFFCFVWNQLCPWNLSWSQKHGQREGFFGTSPVQVSY